MRHGATTSGDDRRAAPGAAKTGSGDNDTPVYTGPSVIKPSQAVIAADRDPAGGAIPVALFADSRWMFPVVRGVEDK